MMNFGRYLLNHDIRAALPDKACLHSAYESFRPYIFTHEQVRQLFELADEIHPNYRNSHIFYPVLFRVLYCTGIRLGEALSMTMADVDLEQLTITIRNPKNHRDRRLPIGESLKLYLEWYIKEVHPVYHEEDLFFMTRGNRAYHGGNCNVYFVSLIKKIGIPYGGYKNRGPSIHCLRHTRAMEYAEQGMPIGIIQRLLGHCSLQMSLHYAKVTEDTLYQKWKKTEKLDLFKPKTLPPGKEIGHGGSVHYESIRSGLDAVRVPFGVCSKPSKAGCRRQTEQCLECPSFCSTIENMDEYASEIEKVRSMICIGQTLGRDEWVKKNEEYLERLLHMQAELQDKGIIHKSGPMRET